MNLPQISEATPEQITLRPFEVKNPVTDLKKFMAQANGEALVL